MSPTFEYLQLLTESR